MFVVTRKLNYGVGNYVETVWEYDEPSGILKPLFALPAGHEVMFVESETKER